MSNHHFVTTRPQTTTCHRCNRLILHGIEEGLPYRVDPAPLTLTGELTAQLANRTTYRLLTGHVVRRTPENITAETPDNRPPVFAWHNCTNTNAETVSAEHIPETQRIITNKTTETATSAQDTDQRALLTLADVLGGHVIESPDDQQPPF